MLERIRKEMVRNNINARDLSIRANIGRSFVYDLLSGRSPNPTTKKLATIANALGVSLQYLISGSSVDSEDFITMPLSLNALKNSDKGIWDRYLLNKKWIASNLKVAPENLRMVVVNGDCMFPTVNHQDMVMVDVSSRVPTKAGIFMLQNGEAMIARRVEFVPGKVQKQVCISPDNSKYVPYTCDIDEVNIVGRVVWLAREVE